MRFKQFVINKWDIVVLLGCLIGIYLLFPSVTALEVDASIGENYIQIEVTDFDIAYNVTKDNERIYTNVNYPVIIFNNLTPNTPYLIHIEDATNSISNVYRTKQLLVSTSYSVMLFMSLLLFFVSVIGNTPVFKIGSFLCGLLALFILMGETTETFYLVGVGFYVAGIIYSFSIDYRTFKGDG